MKFLDRVEELARLQKFLSLEEGGLACLYGRRRIGKSRLLEEALKGRESVVSYCADRSDAALQRTRMAQDMARMLPGFSDVVYRDWRTFLERWQRESPRGNVLVLDELPYLLEKSPELSSVLQKIVDGLRESGQKIIVCGSSQRMMQGLVLDESEPLYGRCRVLMKLAPIGFEWMQEAFPNLSPWSRLEHYAVWGGIPRYWEVCQDAGSLQEALRDEVFSPNGLFHEESTYVLQDDLDGSAQASSVLSLIGQGVERPSEMATRLQIPQTSLGRPLKRLMGLGLVQRDIPFGTSPKDNKKAQYKLADPFLRFWYAFVLPRYSYPHFLERENDWESMRLPFQVFLGQAWEELVRHRIQEVPLPGDTNRWVNIGRWWGGGLNRRAMEIDLVAESLDGKSLLVGEAKLSLTNREAEHALEELKAKAAQLPFVHHYETLETRLFVARGGEFPCISLDWCEGSRL